MAITIRSVGDFKNTNRFLEKMRKREIFRVLDAAGRVGVDALAANTPSDTGATASSWSYEIDSGGGNYSIHWTNSNTNKGFSVVLGLQYGHGTGTGGYVVGRDFINPAIRPIFDRIADTVWKEVVNA